MGVPRGGHGRSRGAVPQARRGARSFLTPLLERQISAFSGPPTEEAAEARLQLLERVSDGLIDVGYVVCALRAVGEVLTWPATHEQVSAAARLVPDEIVQMLTASGTPAEARARVREYVEAGCTCPILYPLGDVRAMIDAFGA